MLIINSVPGVFLPFLGIELEGAFTMLKAGISAIALAALIATSPASAQIDSGIGAPPLRIDLPPIGTEAPTQPALPASFSAADPRYGDQLPREWMVASYHVTQPGLYGLPTPAPGFGWSRYGDHAVLTDQWGRIYLVERNMDWAGKGGSVRARRKTDGIAGGIGGAAVGAVAGNAIAGAGSRLAGSLIGGGIGALAGLGLELLLRKDRRGDRTAYALHWDDRLPYAYQAGPAEYEEITTTRTIPGPTRRVARTTYEYVTVPVQTPSRPAKYMPRRTIKHTKRIAR
jgi:hypothetical protein